MNTKAFDNNFMEKVMEDEAWKKLSSDFPWTEKMLEKFQDKVDWKEVSENRNIVWTPSMLDKFKRRIDWAELSSVESEALMITENIERYKDYWDWKALSRNDALAWSYTLIERFIDYWDWENLINNYRLDHIMLDGKFFEKFQDRIPASKLQNSSLWYNLVEEEKRKIVARIVSEEL